ncbi:hypothetical protein GCM10009827_119540 [Dactylosporangium maewongense]|uniref:Uncharacterized protein n=1 Tax=Dactylosporangium maewongense TaxID=634393 RepID=A0ABN2DHY9_9ACTN
MGNVPHDQRYRTSSAISVNEVDVLTERAKLAWPNIERLTILIPQKSRDAEAVNARAYLTDLEVVRSGLARSEITIEAMVTVAS